MRCLRTGDKLEKLLHEHAAQGWRLKAITAVEVKGRVGPGGKEAFSNELGQSRSTESEPDGVMLTGLTPDSVRWRRGRFGRIQLTHRP